MVVVGLRFGQQCKRPGAKPIEAAEAVFECRLVNLTAHETGLLRGERDAFFRSITLYAADGQVYQLARNGRPLPYESMYTRVAAVLSSGGSYECDASWSMLYSWCLNRDSELREYRYPPSGPAVLRAEAPPTNTHKMMWGSVQPVEYPVIVP